MTLLQGFMLENSDIYIQISIDNGFDAEQVLPEHHHDKTQPLQSSS